MEFRVDLDIFRGPLDLLLYLVRKHELEIHDIPISLITEQYLAYLNILRQLDINAVGDFLEMASTLAEIKSRMILPRGDEEEGDLDDPRQELVRQLLEYKRFKDAASLLEERGVAWQQHYSRLAIDVPPRTNDLSDEPIHEVELWDLVSAFERIIRDNQAAEPSNIVYDDTPIHVYMARIVEQLGARGRLAFSELLQARMHKSMLVGIFLAILELVRHRQARTEQNELFGEIWILPHPQAPGPLDVSVVDNYDHASASPDAPKEPASRPAAKPR